jgi:hypothetical protein
MMPPDRRRRWRRRSIDAPTLALPSVYTGCELGYALPGKAEFVIDVLVGQRRISQH